MNKIFLFIYLYRAFFVFVLLEVICSWLIIQNNSYQGTQFFNSAGSFIAGTNSFSYNVRNYFHLRQINGELAEENTHLREALERQNQRLYSIAAQNILLPDVAGRFTYTGAKVESNTIHLASNYITIDKGKKDGVEPGMAVLGPDGIVGKIRNCSDHFSTVTSILNINMRVSAAIKRTGHFGTVQWDGKDPLFVRLEYIPPYVQPVIGDTVVTSSYNAVFPREMMIGTISNIDLNENFYDLRVKLSQDFSRLSYVTVLKNELKPEQDSLQLTLPPSAQ